MGKKITYDEAYNIFKEKGYILLDTVYVNSKTKMTCEDSDGYRYYVKLGQLKANEFPDRYGKFNIYTMYNINKYIADNNISTTLISGKYINTDSKLKFKCGKCGNIFEVSLHHFIGSNQHYCYECNKHHNEFRKLTKEEIYDIYNKKELTILDLSIEDVGNTTPITCMDGDGYIGKIPYSRARVVNTFDKIHPTNEFSLRNINNYLKLNNRDIRVVEEQIYNGSLEYIKFKCALCGDIFESTWSYIQTNVRANFCPNCSGVKSSLELKIEHELIKNKITYIYQYKFDDCTDKRSLPFDFYIPSQNTVIEVDGEQHEKPINFGGISDYKARIRYNDTVRKDRIKNNYCKTNGIKIIRIPFWMFKDNSYIEKLQCVLKNEEEICI